MGGLRRSPRLGQLPRGRARASRATGYGRALDGRRRGAARAARGCPKINLQVRDTNTDVLAFYEHLGYVVDAAVSMGKRLESDEA